MGQERFLGNMAIMLITLILLTLVSTWQRRHQLKAVFELIAGWCVIIVILACFWGVIILFIKNVIK
jgi:hypothetical protein